MKKTTVILIVIYAVFSLCSFLSAEEKEEKTEMQILQEMLTSYASEKSEANFIKLIDRINSNIEKDYQKGYMTAMKSYIYMMHSGELLDQSCNYFDGMSFGQKFFLGNIYLEKKDYKKAIEIYDLIIKDTPNITCVWRHKGEAHYNLKDYVSAEKALIRSIELKEDHTDAYMWLAIVQAEMDKNQEALKAVDKGIELYKQGNPGCEDEEMYEYYELKADILVNLGNYGEALAVYEKIMPDHPDRENIAEKIREIPRAKEEISE